MIVAKASELAEKYPGDEEVLSCANGLLQKLNLPAIAEKAPTSDPHAAGATLSFAQPQSLPGRLPAPRTRLRVPFTIHNDSSGTRRYQWSLQASRIGNAGGLTARSVSRTISRGTFCSSRSRPKYWCCW